jgi:hypothetical protein
MRLTFGGLESWRIALILSGLAISFGGIFMFGWSGGAASSMGREIAMGGAAVVGLLMVLAGLIGRQTSTSARDVLPALSLFQFVVLPVFVYLTKLSTGWKLVLAAWCVGSVRAAVFIARRRV